MSHEVLRSFALALALAGTACSATPSDESNGPDREAVRVDTENSDAGFPSLAMNDDGEAVLVWTELGATNYQLWSSRYSPGDGWGAAQPIEGASGESSMSGPQVAIDAAGNAIAVWDSYRDGAWEVWAARFEAQSGWGAPEHMGVEEGGTAYGPQVAFDGAGNAMVVWSVAEPPSSVWTQRFEIDGGWGNAELVANHPDGILGEASLATTPSGETAIAYAADEDTASTVYSMRYDPAQGWSEASVIVRAEGVNGGYGGNHLSPKLGMADNGEACAVWMTSGHPVGSIFAARSTPEGPWEDAEVPLADWGSMYPELSVNGPGDTFVVWQDDTVLAGHYDPESGWAATENLEGSLGGESIRPKVTSNDAGDAVAVWHSAENTSDGRQAEVWSSRHDSRAGWQSVDHIASSHPKSCPECVGGSDPQVAIDAAGNALMVWLQYEGSHLELWSEELPK